MENIVNEANFSEILSANKVVLVDFGQAGAVLAALSLRQSSNLQVNIKAELMWANAMWTTIPTLQPNSAL